MCAGLTLYFADDNATFGDWVPREEDPCRVNERGIDALVVLPDTLRASAIIGDEVTMDEVKVVLFGGELYFFF
jgi:hypothetical protein